MARPVLGEVTEPCVPRGRRTSGEPEVGAFPGRTIPQARVPFGRKLVLSPGETLSGRECLLA